MTRVENEAGAAQEQVLAAAQEREATLVVNLQELRQAMQDLSEEHANKEDGLRRQVREVVATGAGKGLQSLRTCPRGMPTIRTGRGDS